MHRQGLRRLPTLSMAITVLASALPIAAARAEPRATEFTLSNGLDVVVIPDHRAPVVTHMVWYKVGSADEPKGVSGIAHFLEHLMFKSTDKIAVGEFSKIISQARRPGQRLHRPGRHLLPPAASPRSGSAP